MVTDTPGPAALAVWAEHWRFWGPALVFCLLAAAEAVRPARANQLRRGWRWVTNLGLHVLDTWLFIAIGPMSLAVAALLAIGGPHVALFGPVGAWSGFWGILVASCLLLDLVAWLIHRVSHAIFPLWRLHAVHHADADVDASTAVRHHPFEFIINGFIVLVVVLVTGMPPWALPVFALLALTAQIWQHANLALPRFLDNALGFVLVTPGQHRAHHAVDPAYFNRNFGTILSIWDRIFRTLIVSPNREIVFGLEPYRAPRFARPHWALMLPFRLRREAHSAWL